MEVPRQSLKDMYLFCTPFLQVLARLTWTPGSLPSVTVTPAGRSAATDSCTESRPAISVTLPRNPHGSSWVLGTCSHLSCSPLSLNLSSLWRRDPSSCFTENLKPSKRTLVILFCTPNSVLHTCYVTPQLSTPPLSGVSQKRPTCCSISLLERVGKQMQMFSIFWPPLQLSSPCNSHASWNVHFTWSLPSPVSPHSSTHSDLPPTHHSTETDLAKVLLPVRLLLRLPLHLTAFLPQLPDSTSSLRVSEEKWSPGFPTKFSQPRILDQSRNTQALLISWPEFHMYIWYVTF